MTKSHPFIQHIKSTFPCVVMCSSYKYVPWKSSTSQSQLTKSPELNINCELDKSVLPSYSSLYMDYFSTANPSSSEFSSVANSSKEKKIKGGKRSKGVKLSTDPQSVAARERRHRISDRFKILQSLVPGGSKMDTVSMLEEAIHYVKFLKTQIWLHQTMINFVDEDPSCFLAASFPSHDQQNFYAENSTLVDQVQPSSPPLPLPNSYFQSEETISLDPYVKY